jgi:hypothetical protein
MSQAGQYRAGRQKSMVAFIGPVPNHTFLGRHFVPGRGYDSGCVISKSTLSL